MRGGLALIAALLVGACQREPMAPVGISRSGAVLREGAVDASTEVASPLPPDFRTTLTKVNRERLLAQGHAGGRFDADIYVTASAKDAAFASVGAIEAGTVVVMEEIEHGKDSSGPLLMMEKMAPGFAKAHGDWRYTVVDGKAVTVGSIESCATCHDEAPHDHVFGLDQ